MKTCTKCRLPQSLDAFGIDRARKDGLTYWCKSCLSAYQKQSLLKRSNRPTPEAPIEKCCTKCLQIKPITEFHRSKNRKDGYAYWCSMCENAYQRAYNQSQPGPHLAKTIEEYLDRYTRYGEGDDCHEWTGTLWSNGYGMGTFQGRTFLVHRETYERKHGKLPKGVLVLHKCDNRRCRRDDHLFPGSAKDNTQDAIQKGRFYRPPRTLTDQQIQEIRHRLRNGAFGNVLAEEYGVSTSTISYIRNRIGPYAYLDRVITND